MYLKIPLTPPLRDDAKREKLIYLVADAHARSALNNSQNASSAAFCNAWSNTRNIQSAIASAILTMGGTHAPVSLARLVYQSFTEEAVVESLEEKIPVAGFGNSFFKDRIDPAWAQVASEIRSNWPEVQSRIEKLEGWLAKHRPGKARLLPNAAMFTGAACSACDMPPGSELVVLYSARINGWISMIPR